MIIWSLFCPFLCSLLSAFLFINVSWLAKLTTNWNLWDLRNELVIVTWTVTKGDYSVQSSLHLCCDNDIRHLTLSAWVLCPVCVHAVCSGHQQLGVRRVNDEPLFYFFICRGLKVQGGPDLTNFEVTTFWSPLERKFQGGWVQKPAEQMNLIFVLNFEFWATARMIIVGCTVCFQKCFRKKCGTRVTDSSETSTISGYPEMSPETEIIL